MCVSPEPQPTIYQQEHGVNDTYNGSIPDKIATGAKTVVQLPGKVIEAVKETASSFGQEVKEAIMTGVSVLVFFFVCLVGFQMWKCFGPRGGVAGMIRRWREGGAHGNRDAPAVGAVQGANPFL